MPSKGIDAYGYVSNKKFKIRFEARGCDNREVNDSGTIPSTHYEIDSANLGHWLFIPTEYSGRFCMHALVNGTEVLQKWAEVSPYSGGASGPDEQDNLNNMVRDQRSYIVPGKCAVSYGFFDAGGWDGCSDRAYMYVTDEFSDWMGELRVADEVTLNSFVLPGAHDAGMYTEPDGDQQARTIIAAAHTFWENLSAEDKTKYGAIAGVGIAVAALTAQLAGLASIAGVIGGSAVISGIAKRALINLANTQKDRTAVQLQLGVRYFDFRPGYNLDGQDRELRHQHMFVPGCTFREFLQDVVYFLAGHSGEIVVVNICYSGFMAGSMTPEKAVVQGAIDAALEAINQGKAGAAKLKTGGLECLKFSYKNLIETNTRLLVVYEGEHKKRDSYSDSAYQTQDPQKVLDALESTLAQPEELWTCLQLQGTYNGTAGGGFSSVANFSDASSALMWTKAAFDKVTYPWVSANVAQKGGNSLLVLLNDFADNALTDKCIDLTKRRCMHSHLTVPAATFSGDTASPATAEG